MYRRKTPTRYKSPALKQSDSLWDFFRRNKMFSAILVITVISYALWPFLAEHVDHFASALITFKNLCRQHPVQGYVVYACLFALVLLMGLPLTTLLMLLAGITYDFWEAATLVTVCRIAAALIAFLISRYFVLSAKRYTRKPPLMRKFEQHPWVTLLIMRLAPVPDSMVNYTMGTTSLKTVDYTLISFIGMIPATLLMVWLGTSLGSVSNLISYFH